MKENKEKENAEEGSRLEVQSQARLSTRDKRKSLSKNLDLGNLPSCRGKKAKHKSSQVIKPTLPSSQPLVQVFDVDSSVPVKTTPSKAPPSRSTAPCSSQLPPRIPINIIENEDLAWECFGKAGSNEDITICYDMSLKDFEHSGVHDLFKVCHYFLPHLSLYCSVIFVSSNHYLIFYSCAGNVKIHCGV